MPNRHSLFTVEGRSRLDTYQDMVDRILACVREGSDVCVAFYGHPGVFVYPSHEAIKRARIEGYKATMLPGISAEDCLFADLGIDPGKAVAKASRLRTFSYTGVSSTHTSAW